MDFAKLMAVPSAAEKAASDAVHRAAKDFKASGEAVAASRAALTRRREEAATADAGIVEAQKAAEKLIADAKTVACVARAAFEKAEADYGRAQAAHREAKDQVEAKQQALVTAKAKQRAREAAAIDKEKANAKKQSREDPPVESDSGVGTATVAGSSETVDAVPSPSNSTSSSSCGDSSPAPGPHEQPGRDRFVTKAAMKKAKERAAKEEAAAEEARKLQRKEAKKERRQAEATAKELADAAAKEAERERRAAAKEARRTRPATIRIHAQHADSTPVAVALSCTAGRCSRSDLLRCGGGGRCFLAFFGTWKGSAVCFWRRTRLPRSQQPRLRRHEGADPPLSRRLCRTATGPTSVASTIICTSARRRSTGKL